MMRTVVKSFLFSLVILLAWYTSAADVVDQIAEKFWQMPKTHPRLLIGHDGVEKFKLAAQTSVGKALAERILYDADQILDLPVCPRQMEGRRMLAVSRNILFRVTTLSSAYYLNGSKTYADRAIVEMVNAAGYENWNPSHFLDVAELTLGMAIGYDWLYEVLTPEQRQTIAQAIIEKGLKPSWENKQDWWISSIHNWNQVCHGGLTAGAIAVADVEPALALKTITRAIEKLPLAMKACFFPQGAYPEGPTYWAYGTNYNAIMLAALNQLWGTDFGLSDQAGFKNTGDYMLAVNSPTGRLFNYADSPSQRPAGFAMVWLSYYFQRPDWFDLAERPRLLNYSSRRQKKSGGEGVLPLVFPFLPADTSRKSYTGCALSYCSGNDVLAPVAVMRSGWSADDAWFGLVAGNPSRTHGHMDCGSFVYENNGVRWVADIGMESYYPLEKIKYPLWDFSQNGGRWQLFRNGPESHSILRVDHHRQNVNEKGTIISATDSVIEVDLSSSYRPDAGLVRRKAELMPGKILKLTDRLNGLKPGAVVSWQMCTEANPETDSNGGMILKSGKQALRIEVNQAVKWLLVSCDNIGQKFESPNPGIYKISFDIIAPASGNVEMTVAFIPIK